MQQTKASEEHKSYVQRLSGSVKETKRQFEKFMSWRNF